MDPDTIHLKRTDARRRLDDLRAERRVALVDGADFDDSRIRSVKGELAALDSPCPMGCATSMRHVIDRAVTVSPSPS